MKRGWPDRSAAGHGCRTKGVVPWLTCEQTKNAEGRLRDAQCICNLSGRPRRSHFYNGTCCLPAPAPCWPNSGSGSAVKAKRSAAHSKWSVAHPQVPTRAPGHRSHQFMRPVQQAAPQKQGSGALSGSRVNCTQAQLPSASCSIPAAVHYAAQISYAASLDIAGSQRQARPCRAAQLTEGRLHTQLSCAAFDTQGCTQGTLLQLAAADHAPCSRTSAPRPPRWACGSR